MRTAAGAGAAVSVAEVRPGGIGEEAMTDPRPAADVPPHVLDHLRQRRTLTLATVSPTGMPHAATLLYANDGPTLYAWVRAESATARHVAHNPAVAFTIDAYDPDWSTARGIQGSGTCRILRAAEEIAHAVSLFRRKFPAMAGEPSDDLFFVELTATELWFIDTGAAIAEIGPEGGSGRQVLGQVYRQVLAYSAYLSAADQEPTPTAPTLTSLRFPAGAVIVRQGTPGDTFYIVVDGEVAVLREEAGQSRRIETLRRGQFFGEIALLRDVPRTATVQALVPTTLLALDRAAFRDLVARSVGTAADFDRIVQRRLGGPATGDA